MQLKELYKLIETLVNTMRETDLASLIDHTLLSPFAREDEILKTVEETLEYGFYCAMLPPSLIRTGWQAAKDAGVRLCTVAGFPAGYAPAEAVKTEIDVVANFVDEIDIVAPHWALKSSNYAYYVDFLKDLVAHSREAGIKVVKVIVEVPHLTDNELQLAAKAVAESGADFLKTSTGVYSKGGDPWTVLRAASVSEPLGLKVKAAGGIRTGFDAIMALAAGANRIGSSSGPKIIETYRKLAESSRGR
jgi:deoxyribose-phosphate aldolase